MRPETSLRLREAEMPRKYILRICKDKYYVRLNFWEKSKECFFRELIVWCEVEFSVMIFNGPGRIDWPFRIRAGVTLEEANLMDLVLVGDAVRAVHRKSGAWFLAMPFGSIGLSVMIRILVFLHRISGVRPRACQPGL